MSKLPDFLDVNFLTPLAMHLTFPLDFVNKVNNLSASLKLVDFKTKHSVVKERIYLKGQFIVR